MRRPPKRPTAADNRSAHAAQGEGDTDFGPLVASYLYMKDGVTFARFPDHSINPPFSLAFLWTFLDDEAASAFAEGYALLASSFGSFASRKAAHAALQAGFANFLKRDEGQSRVALSSIDSALIDEFDAWLHKRHPASRGTRTAKMRAVRETIARLRLMPKWSGLLADDLEFPTKRRDRGKRTSTKNKGLGEANFDALWVAAARKSKRIVALHERRKAALARWAGRTPTPDEAAADPAALATLLVQMYPTGIPPARAVHGKRGIALRVSAAHWQRARSLLMPDIDELLPAILIIAMVFAYNPGVVKGLRYKLDYRFGTSMGRKRLFLSPIKHRPRPKKQRHSAVVSEEGDNPGRVIRFLEERTAFLRSRTPPPHSRMLVLWQSKGEAKSFLGNSNAFNKALADFGKRHRVPDLQMKRVRPSTLDRVHLLTGGDMLKVKSYAHHSSIQTTFRDYETDAIAQRDTEALGLSMMDTQRFVASGGTVRPFLVAPELDKGSATPGYACIDPLTSPIPGEEDGVLCKAYGRCPICPHSALQMTPRAYAYLDALVARIDEGLTNEIVSGVEWISRWAIVKKSVVRQMQRYPDDMKIASAGQTISPLPPLE